MPYTRRFGNGNAKRTPLIGVDVPFLSQKPIKRSRKRIKARAKFKAHGDNPLKSYRRRFSDLQVSVRANIARQARLHNRTRPEIVFSKMLDGMGILYESEAIFQNGDRFILADFYFKAQRLVIELDGSSHNDQKGYDAGRDVWLGKKYGVQTVRLANAEVFRSTIGEKLKTLLNLSDSS